MVDEVFDDHQACSKWDCIPVVIGVVLPVVQYISAILAGRRLDL